MKMDKKMLAYLGLGGLAVWFLFFRKKKNKPATDEEMANFLSRRARKRVKSKLRNAKAKLKKHIKRGGVAGAVHRKLVNRVGKLKNRVIGGRRGARRRNAIKKIRKGGFFGGGCN
jgi:LPXTG-motif cell wall-anchored protein